MPHDTALIATIAIGLAFALIGGYIALRLHLPPLVGYLVAGIAVGPFTPGFVADHVARARALRRSALLAIGEDLLGQALIGQGALALRLKAELAPQLAGIGVILLMFGVGMHFNPLLFTLVSRLQVVRPA